MANRSTIEILKELPVLFRKVEAEKYTEHASVFLTRAVTKGWIYRLSRGYYLNSYLKGWPSVEEVGCFLRAPAYVSGEWALHHHGFLLQVPHVCLIITLQSSVGQSRSVDYRGITLQFSKIAPNLFLGFKRVGHYDLATPEKALLDLLYLRGRIPLVDELELKDLNLNELQNCTKKFPKTVQDKISRLLSGCFYR
jgi:hypothetical protein